MDILKMLSTDKHTKVPIYKPVQNAHVAEPGFDGEEHPP
jgi:hypothetical protein